MASPERLPNFLYIGPDKAGSSWLHDVLIEHPQVFMTPAKDVYFFDRYFDKGVGWYAQHFARSTDRHKIVGEVCQDYLFHPLAAERIESVLGTDVRFMVTLRDPVARAFSSYLYMLKMGQQPGSFPEALRTRSELIEHGRYGSGLDRFIQRFGAASIHVAMFDDLVADPHMFIDGVLAWLDLSPHALTDDLLAARLPASTARSPLVARLARRTADWTREHDGAELVGRVKRSPLAQRLLYRRLEAKPAMELEAVAHIQAELYDDVRHVEEVFGVELRNRWGWRS